jgi:hypothetical protein
MIMFPDKMAESLVAELVAPIYKSKRSSDNLPSCHSKTPVIPRHHTSHSRIPTKMTIPTSKTTTDQPEAATEMSE